MKNPNISKVLKTYRKLNHYSVNDLVLKLEDNNLPVAPKTVYGCESGQTQPDADTLLVLCKIYKIDNILNELSSHDASKLHDRHYDFEKCKELGLKVTALENDQEFQDKVLSLYHSYLLSIYRLPSSVKFIECQRGQTFIINGKRNP